MSKPPKTPPHSDMDGVNEDRRDNVDAAVEAGQDSSDIEREKRESVGRPAYDSVDGKRDEADDGAEQRSR